MLGSARTPTNAIFGRFLQQRYGSVVRIYIVQSLYFACGLPSCGTRVTGATGQTLIMNIKLCGISLHGDIFSILAPDLATARMLGMSRVEEGAWRTWDAFDVTQGSPQGRRLVESSPYEPTTEESVNV